MANNIVKLTEKFIKIKSIADNNSELEKILNLAADQLSGFTIEFFEKNGIKSLLAYTGKKRPKKFKIILNGHLDIIPGKENQYCPIIKGGRLYGAGAMDMKANVACIIEVFKNTARKIDFPLALQLVTDEEIGGFNGTLHQIEKGVRADFVLTSEPTNFDIVNQAKGVIWLRISVRGKSAHGAYPWRGKNAIWEMQKFLEVLKKDFPVPESEIWKTTLNLALIDTGNTAFNKIPDSCSVGIDIRYVPSDSEMIIKKIKKILPKTFHLEILTHEPAMFTDGKNVFLQKLRLAGKDVLNSDLKIRNAQGSSDARHFARVDCPGIEFGPIGGGIGSDNEWVKIVSLEKYCEILNKFIYSL